MLASTVALRPQVLSSPKVVHFYPFLYTSYPTLLFLICIGFFVVAVLFC